MKSKNTYGNIRWLGYAGFWITEKPNIYIDPYNLSFPDIGDAIFITHKHEQHCSPDGIKWLRKGSTIIVAPENCGDLFEGDIRKATPGLEMNIKGVDVKVLPAYTNKHEKHEQKQGGVGYVFSFKSGLRVYHTGDTALIPEMQENMADVVLLPISKETMNAEEAASVINLIKPQAAIPMHWNKKDKDAVSEIEKFIDLCKSEVVILKAKP